MSDKTYISVTDTAKEIRKALKRAFPATTFSVKSKSYSGGASVRITWTDGPTTPMVEKIAKAFQGASFDSMIDLKSYHTSIHNGQVVHWGADYVFCDRGYSEPLLQHAANRIAKRFGLDTIPIITDRWGRAVIDPACPLIHERLDGNSRFDVQDLVFREVATLSAVNGQYFAVVA